MPAKKKVAAKPKKKPAARTKKPAAKPNAKAGAKSKPSPRAQQLHRRALRYNWDGGTPGAIVDDPDCDHGTALAIYWMGAPGFDQKYASAADVDGWRRPTFRFLRALEKRLLRRDFATATILFNPRFDRTTVSSTGHDWTAEYADVEVVRPIPEALKEPSIPDAAWDARGRAPIGNTANRLT